MISGFEFELIIGTVTFIISMIVCGISIYYVNKAFHATNDNDRIIYLLWAIIGLLLLK